jgi:hypothetical protein
VQPKKKKKEDDDGLFLSSSEASYQVATKKFNTGNESHDMMLAYYYAHSSTIKAQV